MKRFAPPTPAPPAWTGRELLTAPRSPELFTLPTGINEFDLCRDGGRVLLAYDDKTQTQIRAAATVEALGQGVPVASIPMRYPCLLQSGGTWHAFGYVAGQGVVRSTASAPEGPWALPLTVAGLEAYGDPSVSRTPDGTWLMAVKSIVGPYPARVYAASSLTGPWTLVSTPLASQPVQSWYAQEQADPSVAWIDGQPTLLFAGWNGSEQVLGAAPLDPATWQASGPAVRVLRPTEAWQQRNGASKIFNPILFEGRLYYSHNVSTGGAEGPPVAAGWGYLALSSADARVVALETRLAALQAALPVQPLANYSAEAVSTAVGQAVTQLPDAAGSADATVPSGLTGPLMGTGPRRLLFGAGRGLTMPLAPARTALTLVVRATLDDVAATQILFEQGTNANEAPGRWLLYVSGGALYAGITIGINTTYNDIHIPVTLGTHDIVLDIDTARGTEAVRLFLDGTLATLRDSSASAVGMTMPADPVFVGHRSGGALPLSGAIRAWRVYGRSLAATERAAAVAALQ